MATTADSSTIEQALKAYRDVGFARLRDYLSAETIRALREESARLGKLTELFEDAQRGAVRQTVPRTDRIDPAIDVSPVFASLASSPQILELAATFLGGEAQLLKDKFIAKPPGAAGYGVHQDVAYWQELGVRGDNAFTIAVCIDRCMPENGTLEFAPGFHHALLTEAGVVSDPDEDQLGTFESVAAEPGDLVLFSGFSPHRSGPNRGSEMRRILFLTYVTDPRPDMYDWYQFKRQTF